MKTRESKQASMKSLVETLFQDQQEWSFKDILGHITEKTQGEITVKELEEGTKVALESALIRLSIEGKLEHFESSRGQMNDLYRVCQVTPREEIDDPYMDYMLSTGVNLSGVYMALRRSGR